MNQRVVFAALVVLLFCADFWLAAMDGLIAWWKGYRDALALGREAQRVHAACVRHGWEDWFGTLVPTRPLTPEEVNAILTDTRSVEDG